jgi:hypothetical protein
LPSDSDSRRDLGAYVPPIFRDIPAFDFPALSFGAQLFVALFPTFVGA